MRLIHLCSEYPPQKVYGLGRYVQQLAEAQAKLGHSVHVVTNSLGKVEHEVVRGGVRVLRVHSPPPPKAPAPSAMLLHFNLQLVERCVEAFRQDSGVRFDVVNVHDWLTVPAGFHVGRLLKAPLVTTIHDVIFNKVRGRQFDEEDAYVAGIENWACHMSSRVVALSEFVKGELLASYHAPPERVHVVPPGVAFEPLREEELPSVGRWRNRHASADQHLLLFVGRLDPEKGLDVLLDAAVLLRKRAGDSWVLLLAGTGRLTEQIEGFVKAQGMSSHVRVAGYLSEAEVRMAYAAADVVVVPSLYEPFGLVAVEAQSMGTPAVVSDTGGLAESLARTRGGVSFPPGNAEALAECLERLLRSQQLVAELGAAGKRNVEVTYRWPVVARCLDDLYVSLHGQGPPQTIVPPDWRRGRKPDASRTGQPLVKVEAGEPLSDVTIFWDTAHEAGLKGILEALHRGHALAALGGFLNVVPVIFSDPEGKPWREPFRGARVRHVRLGPGADLGELLKRSAAVVSHPVLREPLLSRGLVRPESIPVVWCDERMGVDKDGWHVNSLPLLHCLMTKMLCDERFRLAAAPNASSRIPQVSWQVPAREKPMILHVLPQLVTGGAETALLELVKGTRKEFSHEALSLGPLEGPLPREFGGAGCRVRAMGNASPDDVLNAISQSSPDLLHLHSISYVPTWMRIHRRLTGARIVETEHVVNIGSGHFGPVDRVVCVSEAARRAHQPYLPVLDKEGPESEVIYNGLDVEAFRDLPSKEEARRRLGLPLDRPILGRVSALARNKLPPEAMEAIPHILRHVPDALFVIVGDGPDRRPAEEWVKAKGLEEAVLFLGERRDIPLVLRAFDVFVYYTTKDALPVVILEAIGAGVPVVTTNVEGTPEALGEAPGGLASLGDVGSFASLVATWVGKTRGQEAPCPSVLPERFTREAMAGAYAETYNRMLSRHRPQESRPAKTAATAWPGFAPVSVLLPVFNPNPAWLEEALGSVTSQEYPAWELIIVDDGSTGQFHDALQQRIQNDPQLAPRTRILRLPENRGVAAALNAGLEGCRTELVARMDADDRMSRDRLAVQAAFFANHPDISVAGGWAKLIDEGGSPNGGSFMYPCGHRQIAAMLGQSCAFAHPCVMYRCPAVLRVGGYRPECRHYEDYDLWVRLAESGCRFANLPMFLLEYRHHAGSISAAHADAQSHGALACAQRARRLAGPTRRLRVIFTGIYHSYGKPGRGLSIEQLFFARAMQHMPELEVTLLPADGLIRKHGQRQAGEALLRKAEELRADLVFTVLVGPELNFLPQHIQRLTGSGVLTLNWNCDDHWRLPYTSAWIPHYSKMVTTDPVAFTRFSEMGFADKVVLSQWGCNPFAYGPGAGPKDIDVCFVGQAYANRPQMLSALRRAGIKVVVEGAGWRNGPEIDFHRMIELVQRSKIALNFSRASQGPRPQIKARFFEIPACGTFMVTEPADGMEQYLTPGRHYDTFETEGELVAKVRHWLARSERDDWALEASAVVRSSHSYPQRLQEAFESAGLYDRAFAEGPGAGSSAGSRATGTHKG